MKFPTKTPKTINKYLFHLWRCFPFVLTLLLDYLSVLMCFWILKAIIIFFIIDLQWFFPNLTRIKPQSDLVALSLEANIQFKSTLQIQIQLRRWAVLSNPLSAVPPPAPGIWIPSHCRSKDQREHGDLWVLLAWKKPKNMWFPRKHSR